MQNKKQEYFKEASTYTLRWGCLNESVHFTSLRNKVTLNSANFLVYFCHHVVFTVPWLTYLHILSLTKMQSCVGDVNVIVVSLRALPQWALEV